MHTPRADQPNDAASLYTRQGARKYLNADERQRLLAVAETLEPQKRLFVLMLIFTGARLSEALNIAQGSINFGDKVVALVTLKRRRFVVRELPLPDRLSPRSMWSSISAPRLLAKRWRMLPVIAVRQRGHRAGYGHGAALLATALLSPRWRPLASQVRTHPQKAFGMGLA